MSGHCNTCSEITPTRALKQLTEVTPYSRLTVVYSGDFNLLQFFVVF